MLDVPELQGAWTELLGLGSHNAFECVGETDETRLAFLAASQQGLEGQAMTTFKQAFMQQDDASATAAATSSTAAVARVPAVDWERMRSKFDRVYGTDHGIPDFIFDKVSLRMLIAPGEKVHY